MMGVLADMIIDRGIRNRRRLEQMTITRVLRDVSNPFVIGDDIFYQHYRMYPEVAVEFIGLLLPHMRDQNHPHAIPRYLQILAVIRFLAEGGYQKGVGTDRHHPMSQSSVSRYMHHVIPAINAIAPNFIRFPSTPERRQQIQRDFQELLGFPGVLGAVDCTLPKIVAPSDNEFAYLNYKRQHSLSLQIVADPNYMILGTRICSGSTNDRFAWRWSVFRELMYGLRQNNDIVREEGQYFIIGDGGYSLSPILMIPIPRAVPGTPEYRYSRALRRARVIVENVFGILKAKWRCLNKLRGLHYHPIFAAQIVQACTVLHNFLRGHGMPVDPIMENRNEQQDFENDDYVDDNEQLLGVQERQNIIHTYFTN